VTSPVTPGNVILASDYNNLRNFTTARPLCRITASAVQSIAHNVAAGVAIAFGAEDVDTHNFHDLVTNNSRITPSTGWAGYYHVSGTVFMGARSDYGILDCWIRKTGATNLAASGRRGPMGVATSQANSVSCGVDELFLDPALGDYIELMALHFNTAAAAQNTNQSAQFSSTLQLEFLRP
jgi:hypothetical protein